MELKIGTKGLKNLVAIFIFVALLSSKALRAEPSACETRLMIDRLDVVAFYNDYLKKVRKDRAIEWVDNYPAITQFFDAFLEMAQKAIPLEDLNLLATYVHDKGYLEGALAGVVKSFAFGPSLTPAAVEMLSEEARDLYEARYENFANKGNKITAKELGLDQMTPEGLEEFYLSMSKEKRFARELKEALDDGQNPALINIYQESFEGMLGRIESIEDEASKEKFSKAIVGNQMNAIAVKLLLKAIGEQAEANYIPDLSSKILSIPEYLQKEFPTAGSHFTLEDLLTHYLWVYTGHWYGTHGYGKEEQVRRFYMAPQGGFVDSEKYVLSAEAKLLDHLINVQLEEVLEEYPRIMEKLRAERSSRAQKSPANLDGR